MTQDNVIRRFCELGSDVQEFLYASTGVCPAADCFCDGNAVGFSYDEAIVNFIHDAITEKIARSARSRIHATSTVPSDAQITNAINSR